MIFSLDHITQITALEKPLQNNNLKEDYLHKSFKVVNKSLVKYFGKHYLLHRGYFIEDDKSLSVLKFTDIEKKQDNISLAHIELAEELVRRNKSTPFTKLILDRHLHGLVLYSGTKPKSLGKLVFQNLNAIDCHDRLATQLVVPKRQIKELIENYQKQSKDLGESFYAYFIRPFAEHTVYNGILLLLLKRSLIESEYLEIGNLWTKVLSETALLKIANAEQEFIFEEQTHTWYTEITSITQHLDFATKQFTEDSLFSFEETSESVHYAYVKVQQLRIVNAFNLFLLKTRDAKTWKEVTEVKHHLGDESLFKELELEEVSLKKVLSDNLQILNDFVNSLAYADPVMTEKELNALRKVSSQLKELPDFKIYTINVGLSIILLDLLKNALLHADMESPEVEIKITADKSFFNIHILNNSLLRKGAYDFINHNKSTSDISLRRKGGIRTIKRIINSHLLSIGGHKWKIHATPNSLIEKTEIIVSIPKSDVYE